MTVSRRNVLLAGASLPASAFVFAAARAQTPGAAPGAAPRIDKDPLLAACLLIDGRKQIENCSFALTKLTNDEAKAFAKAEVDEHQTIKANLQKLGFTYPVTAAAGAGGTPADGRTGGWVVAIGRTPLPPEAASQVAVDHEVADQCVANYRREMGQLTGVKLDKRFIGHQLDTHLMLLDKAQTFRRHASPALAPVLDEGLKVIEAHIAACKAIMEKLDAAKV